MTTDPRLVEVERRVAQLETARLQLDAALGKRAESPAPAVDVSPLPEIKVEETSIRSSGGEIVRSDRGAVSSESSSGRIRLWVVYQSALQEIEVDGNLI
jgi:hypothetical protein